MPGEHFDLATLGIDPASTDEAVRVLRDGAHWAIVVDPDIVGPAANLGSLCLQIMKRGAKIYSRQQNRNEAEVLMEVLASLEHHLQQPPETSH